MKKTIIIVVLTGMFVWAVYDLVSSTDDTDMANDTDFTVEENTSGSNSAEENGNANSFGLQVGKKAPDFELETLDGKQVALSDYRGQRVMLNFWATWCPPCRAEMPDMQKFYENKDVEILAVNLTSSESSRSDVPNFVDEFDLTFPILMDENNNAGTTYQIQPIPSSYMIDSEGRIQYKALGAMNYERMVQEFEKMK
ncbi:redoxin domain-containing protein [Lentibacillus juripiscarius]|uniref:Redoxin domain-containing protein n=1 Tax=Lentibacillus juripiscarius TaxID=257446 RepID=A0ABW5V464_9BACI